MPDNVIQSGPPVPPAVDYHHNEVERPKKPGGFWILLLIPVLVSVIASVVTVSINSVADVEYGTAQAFLRHYYEDAVNPSRQQDVYDNRQTALVHSANNRRTLDDFRSFFDQFSEVGVSEVAPVITQGYNTFNAKLTYHPKDSGRDEFSQQYTFFLHCDNAWAQAPLVHCAESDVRIDSSLALETRPVS